MMSNIGHLQGLFFTSEHGKQYGKCITPGDTIERLKKRPLFQTTLFHNLNRLLSMQFNITTDILIDQLAVSSSDLHE